MPGVTQDLLGMPLGCFVGSPRFTHHLTRFLKGNHRVHRDASRVSYEVRQKMPPLCTLFDIYLEGEDDLLLWNVFYIQKLDNSTMSLLTTFNVVFEVRLYLLLF